MELAGKEESTLVTQRAVAASQVRESLRAKIEAYDEDLAKVWDQLNEMNDTNEILRHNFMEVQVLIREAQDEFYAKKKRDQALLEQLLAGGEEKYEEFRTTQQEITKQDAAERKHITTLWKTAKQLAQEYRQCAMQKRYTLHVAVVQAWKMAMENAVYRHVSDENVRRLIAEDVREAGRALCPVAADSDI